MGAKVSKLCFMGASIGQAGHTEDAEKMYA